MLTEPVNEGKSRYKLNDKFDLVINDVNRIDSGYYTCVYQDNRVGTHALTVTINEPFVTITNFPTNNSVVQEGRTFLHTSHTIPKHNLTVFWDVSKPSRCSTCDDYGMEKKVGICMIKPMSGSATQFDAETKSDFWTAKTYLSVAFIHNLRKYQQIPCRSFLVPPSLQQDLEKYRSFIDYKLCKVKCYAWKANVKEVMRAVKTFKTQQVAKSGQKTILTCPG